MKRSRIALALALLLVFGGLKLPFERRLKGEFRAAHFFEYEMNRNVREKTGQMGFAAALGGFRAVVADYAYIRAYMGFENTDWAQVKFYMDVATTLQPRSTLFWDTAGWHMAWNASIGAEKDETAQPRATLRRKVSREYLKLGEEFYLRGIGFNPDRSLLYKRLGDLYRDRMEDHCRAAWAYSEAAARPDCLGYVERAAVYELAVCPGHEAEALRLAKALYAEGPRQRLPTLLHLIESLQQRLNVPASERIDITKDLEEATPGRKPAAPANPTGAPHLPR